LVSRISYPNDYFILDRHEIGLFLYLGRKKNTILEDIINRPGVAIPMVVGFLAGITSFATGLSAIVKKKERALLVHISTFVGNLLILFLIGEFAFPH